MDFTKTTEQDSNYNHLEKMEIHELLVSINTEDKTVPIAVEKALPQIENLIQVIVNQLKRGGRLFYIGAGTSGRLGILDASDVYDEFCKINKIFGWEDLKAHNINQKDVVVGIAASGITPYVISALEACNKNNITTGCITCNKNSPLSKASKFPIEVIVGPEFVTGSSRMKAGTAQKLVLNMITTTTMIQLGHIKGNKMVDMQLSNNKLVDRGIRMLMNELKISQKEAEALLDTHKNVRLAIQNYQNGRT